MAISKFKGIDERAIKCCDTELDTIEAGISFDEDNSVPILRFHYLEYVGDILYQKTKTMHLDKKNIEELIEELKRIKKSLR